MCRKTFSKSATTIAEQIQLLKNRGVIIDNDEYVQAFLSQCSYYRFCGFALHFEKLDKNGNRLHSYRDNTKFNEIVELCNFDRDLRSLLFKYSGIIEVNFRTVLANKTAVYYDNPHWYLESEYFCNIDAHTGFLNICHKEFFRSTEVFVSSYKKNYDTPELPPIWMLTEVIPFASWSKLFQNLKDKKLKHEIAFEYNISAKYLESWLQAITFLRNCCAHHMRIWNKNFTLAPKLSPRIKKKIISNCHKKISVLFLIMYDILKQHKQDINFRQELISLIEKYPSISLKYMGVPKSIYTLLDKDPI